MSVTELKKLLHGYQTAKILGVSDSWLEKGRVYGYGPPYIKLRGGRGGIRYLERDVRKWLEDNRSVPGQE